MISSFSILTYSGSLYLQKNTRNSLARMSGRFCKSRLMFRRATHWISGAEETRVTARRQSGSNAEDLTKGRGHFARKGFDELFATNILDMDHDHLHMVNAVHSVSLTLTAPRTTAALTCWNCGRTLSQICSLSLSSTALYRANVVKIAIRPHSEHSLSATSKRVSVG